jgi:hypothetical protein
MAQLSPHENIQTLEYRNLHLLRKRLFKVSLRNRISLAIAVLELS